MASTMSDGGRRRGSRAILFGRAATVGLAAVLAGPVQAAPPPPAPAQAPANPDPAAVRPGAYRLEATHSRAMFSLSHMGFSSWFGDFAGLSGELTIDPRSPAAARVEVVVPVGSVTTTSAKVDGELKGPAWFDTAQFPTARFVSRTVTPTGAGRADITGELTLHGVTRPLVLHARFNGAGVNPIRKAYTVGFDAHGVIRRSDFGVARSVPLIGDEVELTLSCAFEAE